MVLAMRYYDTFLRYYVTCWVFSLICGRHGRRVLDSWLVLCEGDAAMLGHIATVILATLRAVIEVVCRFGLAIRPAGVNRGEL
jgi:hypothetical protein